MLRAYQWENEPLNVIKTRHGALLAVPTAKRQNIGDNKNTHLFGNSIGFIPPICKIPLVRRGSLSSRGKHEKQVNN